MDICKVIEWPDMQNLAIKEEAKEKVEQAANDEPSTKRKGKNGRSEEKKSTAKVAAKDTKPTNTKKGGGRKSIIKEQFEESQILQEQSYFDVFKPGTWRDEMEKVAADELFQKIEDLVRGRYKAKIELQKINDPVFEEGKKEEKPVAKAAKKGDKPVEEEVKKEEEVIDYTYLLKGP